MLFVVDTIAAFAAVMSHTLLITVVAILPPAFFAYGKGVEFVLALELVRQRVGFSFILIKGAWAGIVSAFLLFAYIGVEHGVYLHIGYSIRAKYASI